MKLYYKRLILLFTLSLSGAVFFGCNPSSENLPKVEIPEIEIPVVDPIQEKLSAMTLDEKIGQLFIVGFQQNATEEDFKKYINTYKVGGFIFFKRNLDNFETLYNLTNELKTLNQGQIPLFFAVDEEGGTVSRMPKGGTKFPDGAKIGKTGDPSLSYGMGKVLGKELTAAGINFDCAPVLDVLTNKNSDLLKKRAFSSNPATVAEYGAAFIDGLNSENVMASGKHFPGHGATKTDSHLDLPIVDVDLKTLLSREMIPFRAAIDKDVAFIMVGHLAFPKIDPSGVPATRSKIMLQDILRDELGFMGLAITDDTEMAGFTHGASLEEATVESFLAGIDIFLACHTPSKQDVMISAIKSGVENQIISMDRLDESVYRILSTKEKYLVTDDPNLPFEEAKSIYGSAENKAFLKKITDAINKSQN